MFSQGDGWQLFAVSKSGTDDSMPSSSRIVVLDTLATPQSSPTVDHVSFQSGLALSFAKNESTRGAMRSSKASAPSATSLRIEAPVAIFVMEPHAYLSSTAALVPAGSTTPAAAAETWSPIWNARLNEALYFAASCSTIAAKTSSSSRWRHVAGGVGLAVG